MGSGKSDIKHYVCFSILSFNHVALDVNRYAVTSDSDSSFRASLSPTNKTRLGHQQKPGEVCPKFLSRMLLLSSWRDLAFLFIRHSTHISTGHVALLVSQEAGHALVEENP